VGNNFEDVYIIYFDGSRQISYFFPIRLFYHKEKSAAKKELDKDFCGQNCPLTNKKPEKINFFQKRD